MLSSRSHGQVEPSTACSALRAPATDHLYVKLQYGAVFDVAEWFNDFVAVVEGEFAGAASTTPRKSKGRKRLSMGTSSSAAGLDKPMEAAEGRRGRKRKTADVLPAVDAGDSTPDDDNAVAVDGEDGAARSGKKAALGSRDGAAASSGRPGSGGKQQKRPGKGVRWAADDAASKEEDSDALVDDIEGQCQTDCPNHNMSLSLMIVLSTAVQRQCKCTGTQVGDLKQMQMVQTCLPMRKVTMGNAA